MVHIMSCPELEMHVANWSLEADMIEMKKDKGKS